MSRKNIKSSFRKNFIEEKCTKKVREKVSNKNVPKKFDKKNWQKHCSGVCGERHVEAVAADCRARRNFAHSTQCCVKKIFFTAHIVAVSTNCGCR